MEVAILLYQDCFFSQRAEVQLSKALETMVGNVRPKLNLTIHTYDIKDIESHSKATQVHRAKAQVLIISHHFLDRLRHDTNMRKKASPVNRILRAKRVIGILLSLTAEEITAGFQQYLIQFPEWYTIELKSSNKLDPEFYKKFTEQIVKIYNLELSNTVNFSIFPKKVTKDQPKVVILFKQTLKSTDKVHLELSRGRQHEQIEEVMLSNPQAGMIRIPLSICEDRTSLIEITVYVNNQKLGTKLVKFDYNSKTSEEDTIDKMSSVIPAFRKALDDHISQKLSKNFRTCEDFTLDSSLELMNDALICRGDDFPTVMHFAANYGLEQTVCVLLYEGDGLEQSTIKNDVGETPVDIAQEKGFGTIAQTIKDFYEMTNTFGALQCIKDLCDRHSKELELLSIAETRESLNSNITLTKFENEDGAVTVEEEEERKEDIEKTSDNNFHQTSPEYLFLHNDDNELENIISENQSTMTDVIINVEETEKVTIRVESPQIGDSREKMMTRRHSLHGSLTVPLPKLRAQINRGDYVNVNPMENEEIQTNKITKLGVIQTYDVPPPPSPVLNFPPPIKVNSMPYLTVGGNSYDVPRTSINDYCLPLSSRQVFPGKPCLNAIEPTIPILSIKSNLALYGPDGYMFMNTENNSSSNSVPVNLLPRSQPPQKPARATKPKDGTTSKIEKYPEVYPPIVLTSGLSKMGFLNTTTIATLPLTKQFSLDPTQEELLELMNDFKNNVYNLRELELLYENWKQRNDVQRDSKVRQKELKDIQKEYKKIQEKIRRETKKPGPIAKLIKLMPGARKKISVPSMESNIEKKVAEVVLEEPIRKVSGSSDRCSTLSESSVPDSGVSDPDSDKDRLRSFYVEPSVSHLEENESKINESITESATPPIATMPPCRPPKKSTSSDVHPLLGKTTPPRSPKVSTDKPPLENPDLITKKMITTTVISEKERMEMEGTLPKTSPALPPRMTKTDSPFSYINYKGKAKGLFGMTNTVQAQQQIQPIIETPDHRIKSTYANQLDQKK